MQRSSAGWWTGCSVAALCLALLVGAAQAQSVPSLINYQGQISNPDGSAPATADYELTFSIYDSPSGGAVIWGPQKFTGSSGPGLAAKVPVVQGYFNVMLGPVDTASRSINTAFSNATRYVEIKVGTNTPVAPRQQILSAPYALLADVASQAFNSATLAGSDWKPLFGTNSPAGAILPGKIPAASIDAAKLADGGVSNVKLTNGAVDSRVISAKGVAEANLGDGSVSVRSLAQEVADLLVPAGTIVAFGGNAVPPGWLLCDGRALDNRSFSKMFAAIGYSWGKTPDPNIFRLPDLRGIFLRGVDFSPNVGPNSLNRDPDHDARGTWNGSEATGNTVGSYQDDQLKSHTHTFDVHGGGFPDATGASSVYRPHNSLEDRPTTPTGGNETRPKNAYVNYIIKF